MLDPARASYVTQEYRYTTGNEDPSIKANFPASTEVVVETNLDQSAALTLASTLYGALSLYARVFTVEVEGVLYLEDFTVAPNRYVVNFGARHVAAGTRQTYTVIAAEVDYLANRTTLTVRG